MKKKYLNLEGCEKKVKYKKKLMHFMQLKTL